MQPTCHQIRNQQHQPSQAVAWCYLLVTTVSTHEWWCFVERVRNKSTERKQVCMELVFCSSATSPIGLVFRRSWFQIPAESIFSVDLVFTLSTKHHHYKASCVCSCPKPNHITFLPLLDTHQPTSFWFPLVPAVPAILAFQFFHVSWNLLKTI